MTAALRSVLLAVTAAAVAGATALVVTDSYGWTGTLAGTAYTVVAVLTQARRQTPAEGERDLDALTRADAAGVSLAALTAALVPALVLVGGSVEPRSTGLAVLAAGVVSAATTALAAHRAPSVHGSTGVVLAVVVMLMAQLAGAGSATAPRGLMSAVALGIGWGTGAAAAHSMAPAAGGRWGAVLVGSVTALMGWLAGLAGPAVGILLPVLTLAVAMVASIWAEVIPAASDRFLSGSRRRR